MQSALWILIIVFMLIDGWLNFNERRSLVSRLFGNSSEATRRYGGLAVYALLIAALIYLGWGSR